MCLEVDRLEGETAQASQLMYEEAAVANLRADAEMQARPWSGPDVCAGVRQALARRRLQQGETDTFAALIATQNQTAEQTLAVLQRQVIEERDAADRPRAESNEFAARAQGLRFELQQLRGTSKWSDS